MGLTLSDAALRVVQRSLQFAVLAIARFALPDAEADELIGLLLERSRHVGLAAAVSALRSRLEAAPPPAAEDAATQARVLERCGKIMEVFEEYGVGAQEPAARPLPSPPGRKGAEAASRGPGVGGGAAGGSSGSGATAPQHCHHCGKAPGPEAARFKICGGCRAVRFCGAECQRAGWKAHKAECGAAAAAVKKT